MGNTNSDPHAHSLMNAINNDSDRVLVLIQLSGGNDGLNMIIPNKKWQKNWG